MLVELLREDCEEEDADKVCASLAEADAEENMVADSVGAELADDEATAEILAREIVAIGDVLVETEKLALRLGREEADTVKSREVVD